MMSTPKKRTGLVVDEKARIAARRRAVFLAGMVSMILMLAMISLTVGAGCIFDEGGTYDGGGRRTTAPTVEDTAATSSGSIPTTSSGGSSGNSSGAADTGIQ